MAENLALDRLLQVAQTEESARANPAETEKAGDGQSETNGPTSQFLFPYFYICHKGKYRKKMRQNL